MCLMYYERGVIVGEFFRLDHGCIFVEKGSAPEKATDAQYSGFQLKQPYS